ncbi:MAG: FprA family A-type flavoprotein [Firmicutes bacterium]|nr:FprA family A-type flavoprotein [Bacillota bacterium]
MIKKITERVSYIGVQDEDLRKFDIIFDTIYGTTYNSYLVQGREKTVIIDTVKNTFTEQYLKNIEELTTYDKIDYIVINHAEPDHSGSLEKLLEKAINAKVVCSRPASMMISEIVNRQLDFITVGTGDSLSLGDVSLEFMNTPYLHWPETMFTYLRAEKVLFPCDFFGSHYGGDTVDYSISDDAMWENRRFYFDSIMSPFKKFAIQAMDKIEDWEVEIICPSHGPVLREDFKKTKEIYRQWASEVKKEKKILVGYLSCYGFTKSMAVAIAKGITDSGIKSNLVDLSSGDSGDLVKMIHESDAIAIGSATVNRDVLEPFSTLFAGVCTYVVRDKNAVTFGSYGWSGEAPKHIGERLTQLGFNVIGSYKTKLKPNEEALKESYNLGVQLAKSILE